MAKSKLLIADDSKSMQMFYSNQLPEELFDVQVFGNGRELIDGLCSCRPDLIILDFDMPEMNGLETLTYIRQEVDLQQVPVIMVTSRAEKEKVLACAKLGVTGYVIKPFKVDELLYKITACLP